MDLEVFQSEESAAPELLIRIDPTCTAEVHGTLSCRSGPKKFSISYEVTYGSESLSDATGSSERVLSSSAGRFARPTGDIHYTVGRAAMRGMHDASINESRSTKARPDGIPV
jgi:hypothetical protein